MRKIIGFVFILVLVITLNACKKTPSATEQPAAADTETVQVNGSVLSGSQTTGSVDSKLQINDAASLRNSPVSYKTITDFNVKEWTLYSNGEYGFSFSYPKAYAVFELLPGQFMLTSESTGDFFEISIQDAVGNTLHSGNPLRTSQVEYNGNTFTVEEFEQGGQKTIAYYVTHNGKELKIYYSFTAGLEAYQDLFNQTMKSFKLY